MALTHHAHQLITAHFTQAPKGVAVDATCGNGHDTEFLIRLGFTRVIAFDVQEIALHNTAERLRQAQLPAATLIHHGHQTLDKHVDGPIDCVMFNFGYLPKADKQLTTQSSTSLRAIELAMEQLSPNGLISLLCYPGHPEGAQETKAIDLYLQQTINHTHWHVDTHLCNSPKATAPILYMLKRK